MTTAIKKKPGPIPKPKHLLRKKIFPVPVTEEEHKLIRAFSRKTGTAAAVFMREAILSRIEELDITTDETV